MVELKWASATDHGVADVVREHWLELALIAASTLVLLAIIRYGFRFRAEVAKAKIKADSDLGLNAQ